MNSNSDINKKTIRGRIVKDKKLIIEQLSKTPIVTLVAEKTGIGRSTYYRWKKEDAKFSNAADAAIVTGNLLINDLAESQLLSSIRDGNLTGIIFWLKHHHPAYETRIELRHAIPRLDEKLSARQEKIIGELLSLASPDDNKQQGGKENEKEDK